MANVELIIKIPEDEYNDYIQGKGDILYPHKYIHAGTLLPKGHGNLKDVDPIIDELQRTRTYSLQQAIDIETFKKDLMNAPTIIEADETESESKE